MNEIVKILREMSLARAQAVNRCGDLGYEFVEHFHKIYSSGGLDDPALKHHCAEMQAWWNKVKKIVLSNKRRITDEQLIEWFFYYGSSLDEIFEEQDEKDYYTILMSTLLEEDKSVSQIIEYIYSH